MKGLFFFDSFFIQKLWSIAVADTLKRKLPQIPLPRSEQKEKEEKYPIVPKIKKEDEVKNPFSSWQKEAETFCEEKWDEKLNGIYTDPGFLEEKEIKDKQFAANIYEGLHKAIDKPKQILADYKTFSSEVTIVPDNIAKLVNKVKEINRQIEIFLAKINGDKSLFFSLEAEINSTPELSLTKIISWKERLNNIEIFPQLKQNLKSHLESLLNKRFFELAKEIQSTRVIPKLEKIKAWLQELEGINQFPQASELKNHVKSLLRHRISCNFDDIVNVHMEINNSQFEGLHNVQMIEKIFKNLNQQYKDAQKRGQHWLLGLIKRRAIDIVNLLEPKLSWKDKATLKEFVQNDLFFIREYRTFTFFRYNTHGKTATWCQINDKLSSNPPSACERFRRFIGF